MSRTKWAPKAGSDDTDIRTNTDFVRHVENTLGVIPDVSDGTPWWKARAAEAGKLKRKRATDPDKYTIDNLLLAVEYCRRRGIEVRTATALCWKVDDALEAAHRPRDRSEMAEAIEAAIDREHREQRPGWREWVGRLLRARGIARTHVYDEWSQLRGGVA